MRLFIHIFLLIILSFFYISAINPACKKLKIVSATVQKTIPGYRGADIKEKYIFICKKSASRDITIKKVWKGNAQEGRYIDFKIMKSVGGKAENEQLETLSSVKTFTIVAIYKYPVDLANNPEEKSNDLCPIVNFEGRAIIEYSLKTKHKLLIINKIEQLETIRKR